MNPTHRLFCFVPAAFSSLALTLAGPVTGQAPVAVDLPSFRGVQDHAVAYDSAREQVVLFGGLGAAGYLLDETWVWNGSNWHQRAVTVAPSPRRRHAMAFDEARRKVVLFGGRAIGGPAPVDNDETWEWDGRSWTQSNPVHRPPASAAVAMAYDSVRQRTVLVVPNDSRMWEWDGSDWTGIATQTPGGILTMAFDPIRQRTLAYIGYGWGGPMTYEWDGTSWQPSSANSPPGGVYPAMVWDAARSRMVLNSHTWNSAWRTETWEYDGAQWALASQPGAPGYLGARLAYDAARRETIAVGGESNAAWARPQQPIETLAWDGTNWRRRHVGAGHGSSARGLVADTARSVLVSFDTYDLGGAGIIGTVFGKSTRAWDGARWRHRPFSWSTPHPSAVGGDHAMSFDSARGVSLLFGGSTDGGLVGLYAIDETWEWDGVNWTQVQPGASPPARVRHAMAFDAARGSTLLFGGSATGQPLGDTWTFDGTTWTQRAPAYAPSARYGHGLAFDPVRGVAVLHGGRDANGILGDTWTWDGTDWQPAQAANAPPAADHPFCWDPSRQQVVAYIQDTLWGFDGTAWSPVVAGPQNLPPANGGAMAFDVVRQALVVTGPNGVTRLLGDVTEPTSQPLGAGCPGTGGVPHLASVPPRLGDAAFSVEVNDGLAFAPVWLGLAFRSQPVAIGAGCRVLSANADSVVFGTLSVFGHAEAPLPIPLHLSLRGLDVYAQAIVLDPQAAIGLAISNGLRLRIGD